MSKVHVFGSLMGINGNGKEPEGGSYRVCKYVTRLLEIVYPDMVYTDYV